MIEYGFTRPAAKLILKNNEDSDVANAIKSVNIQILRGVVKNPKAMFTRAVEEKWRPDKFRERKAGKING